MASFNSVPIEAFLCQHFGVRDINDIANFYGRGMTPGWRYMKHELVQVEYKLSVWANAFDLAHYERDHVYRLLLGNENVSVKRTAHPDQNKWPVPHDTNEEILYVYGASIGTYSLKGDRIGVRFTAENRPFAQEQMVDVHDKTVQAAGMVSRVVTIIRPGEEELDTVLMPVLEFGCASPELIRTTTLLNEQNIWNGLILLPADTCIKAGLRIRANADDRAIDVDEEDIGQMLAALNLEPGTDEASAAAKQYIDGAQEKFDHASSGADQVKGYYFVPADHVLAWPHRSELADTSILAVSAPNKRGIIGYIIDDVRVKSGIEGVCKAWLGKQDPRPRTSVGLEIIPIVKVDGMPYSIDCVINGSLRYFKGPKDVDLRMVAPALSPDFPSVDKWKQKSQGN